MGYKSCSLDCTTLDCRCVGLVLWWVTALFPLFEWPNKKLKDKDCRCSPQCCKGDIWWCKETAHCHKKDPYEHPEPNPKAKRPCECSMKDIHEVAEPQLVEESSHHIPKEHDSGEGNQIEHCHCNRENPQYKMPPTKVGQGWLIQPNLLWLACFCIIECVWP